MTDPHARPRTGPRVPWSRRPVVWVWLAGVVAALVISGRTAYVADLSAFLPSSPSAQQAALLDQITRGSASRLVLIGIEGGDAGARGRASLGLAGRLRAGGLFASVDNGDRTAWSSVGPLLFEHRYQLSPAVDAERFSAGGLRAAIDDTVALLGTPAGTLVKPVLLRDPTGETVRMAEAMQPAEAPRVENGVWVSRRAARTLIVATTRADGADLDGQERALASIRGAFRAVASSLDPAATASTAVAPLRLAVSGAGTFGVAARAQIRAEVERLAALGSIGLVVWLWLAFGSLRALAIAALPVVCGVLAGIAAVSLGFGHVHGLTLGFGTTLIGEAVDYAIFYLIQARHRDGAPDDPHASATTPPRGGAEHWLRTQWPTVRLGLWTSLCGFAALVFSGFPGLAQLGVFSVAGLAAAAFTTRHIFPIVAPDGAPGTAMRHRLGRVTARVAGSLLRWRIGFLGLTLLAVVAMLALPSPWRGQLAGLSPISADALALDADLRADLGAADAGTLIAIAATSEAEALEHAEAAGARLDPMVARGQLQGYDSPARVLPSPRTQAQRRAALPDAATLRSRLAEATAGGPLRAERLQAFVADVETARAKPMLDRKALDGTPLAAVVDALLIAGDAPPSNTIDPARPWRALLTLHAGAAAIDTAAVQRAIDEVPGAQVIAVQRELDALYASYLHRAAWQALAGAAAVCVLLGASLRSVRRLLAVAWPIAAAVVIVLGALTAGGVALGILHLVGLLLVVAIGSNYALFFEHLQARPARASADPSRADDVDTLASLLLANLTAVWSFGLLAFSNIAVLQAIGIVVAPGAFFCLLLSAAWLGGSRGKMAESR